jgi:Protein of unknown function (DUF3617)
MNATVENHRDSGHGRGWQTVRAIGVLTILGLATASSPALAQAINLHPGQYEITVEVNGRGSERAGSGRGAMPMCLASADAKTFVKQLMKASRDAKQICSDAVDVKNVGSTTTLTWGCGTSGSGPSAKEQAVLSGDSFVVTTNLQLPTGRGEPVRYVMKRTGRRVGACPK